MFNSHCTVANARKGTVFRHQTEEKVGFCWFGNLVSAKMVFSRSRKIYLEKKKKENSFGVTISRFLFTRSGQDGSQVPQQPWMSVWFSIPLKQENSTLTAPRSFNLAPMHMAYGIYAVLHFRSNFSHGFLAFSGVREPDYQGGGNLRKLRHKQTFHKCPAFQVQQQQQDEACVNICSDSLSLLSHQNSHCLSQTTVIMPFIWSNVFVIFLNISFILFHSPFSLTHFFHQRGATYSE